MPSRTRPSKQAFATRPLQELTRQLLFAPPLKRMEQVRRAEVLHDELDARLNYPLDFVVFRLTGYRSDEPDPDLLIGEALLPDLRLLIDRLSASAPLPISPQEPVLSVPELAERWKVSTKTVRRWRELGLRWRWVQSDDPAGRRLGFTLPAIDAFTASQQSRVQRAARFTHLTEAQRMRLLQRARRLAAARQLTLNQVATHLARRTSRAVETIRQLLEHHDRDNPGDPLFADRTGPLTDRQKRVIERAYRRGVGVRRLSEHFQRTRSTIYRALRESRAHSLRQTNIQYVANAMFQRPDADEVILRTAEAQSTEEPATPITVRVDDLPAEVQPLYEQPVLGAARQRQLSVRMNYLKFKAALLREKLDPYEPRTSDVEEAQRCLREARVLRDQLVGGHLRVVLSVTRRHLMDQPEASTHRLMDLLERGHEVLFDAVEQYDAARGRTFESYLTWRLLRHFAGEPASPRAQRRLSGAMVLQRMTAAAAQRGIRLLPPPAAAPTAPPA